MLKRDTIYVQIYKDRLVVRNTDTGASTTVARDQTFASPRMLVADFTMAEHQLRSALKEVKRGFFSPQLLVHPMELIEGGITQVEYRTFMELGVGAGASKVGVWEGKALPDDRVRQAIHDYKH